MIRQDYLLRQVQELTQRLARAIFLRARGERETALQEVAEALRLAGGGGHPDVSDPEAWVKLCRDREPAVGPLWVVVGDLLEEMARSLELGPGLDSAAASRVDSIRVCGLVLKLEALLAGAVPVTRELLQSVEESAERLRGRPGGAALASRLFAMAVARGRWSEAEDALFDWVATRDPRAAVAGREFYDRLDHETDAAVEEGGLSRAEVGDGRRDLERLLAPGQSR